MKKTFAILYLATVVIAKAQTPVEVFTGHERTTIDILFFGKCKCFSNGMYKNYCFTQRARFGLQIKRYQFGAAAGFNETGKRTFTRIYNMGAF